MSDAGSSHAGEEHRPPDNKFCQQTLPAWEPLMSGLSVLSVFFITGLIFIPIGIALTVASESVHEVKVDYTDNCIPTDTSINTTCGKFLTDSPGDTCECELTFELKQYFPSPVYMYYGLRGFYQNHRLYMRSRDDFQLIGRDLEPQELNQNCVPYRCDVESEENNPLCDGQGYAPAGAIAYSVFNDTFMLTRMGGEEVPLLGDNIAWDSDKQIKFRNPVDWQTDIYVKPESWPKQVWELDLDNPENNGYQNEDFIVWMRSAAFPVFRKFHRRVDHSSGSFTAGLEPGKYRLTVNYTFPVASFDGRKEVILSTTSWSGGKNLFLGVGFIVVGSIYVIGGVVFLALRLANRNSVSA